jgi:hypothetical protein
VSSRQTTTAASNCGLASGLQHRWSVPVADPLGSNPLEIRMAEIRVEPRRRSLAWLWILLGVIVVGGLVYYYMYV